jgi:hypothetical protein
VKLRTARLLAGSFGVLAAVLACILVTGAMVLFMSGWYDVRRTTGAKPSHSAAPTGSPTASSPTPSSSARTVILPESQLLPGGVTVADWLTDFDNVGKLVGRVTLKSSLKWQAHHVVNILAPTTITTESSARFSVDCNRNGTKSSDGKHLRLAPGPYVLHLGGPAVPDWTQDGDSPKKPLFTLEGVACRRDDYSPTGTSWKTVSVTSGHAWQATSPQHNLIFPLPNAGLTESQIRPYPAKVVAFIWIADNGDYIVGSPP